MKKIKVILLLFTLNLIFVAPVKAEVVEVRDIVFPIMEGFDYSFTDTFGAARSGGRSHEGTDIIVKQMTPLVAAVDGRVTSIVEHDQGWGLAIYIEDDEGYSYRYLHVNNDTPGTDDGKEIRQYAFPSNIVRGTQVQAGQVIAFAGDSGNAESVTHHLHFEIWTPGDGSRYNFGSGREVINSYYSLMASIGQPVQQVDDEPVIINDDQQTTSVSSYYFARDLEYGDEGQDVLELQKYLNANGYIVASSGAGSPGNETDYFGSATQSALIEFQIDNNISPAVGYFGPLTRSAVNATALSPKVDDSSSPVKIGWLVKDKVLPKVFYVANNLELQWIVDEEAAVRNFGEDWTSLIHEFDDLEALGLRFGDYIR